MGSKVLNPWANTSITACRSLWWGTLCTGKMDIWCFFQPRTYARVKLIKPDQLFTECTCKGSILTLQAILALACLIRMEREDTLQSSTVFWKMTCLKFPLYLLSYLRKANFHKTLITIPSLNSPRQQLENPIRTKSRITPLPSPPCLQSPLKLNQQSPTKPYQLNQSSRS